MNQAHQKQSRQYLQQYLPDDALECYRPKLSRRRKRLVHWQRERQWRALFRESNELSVRRRALGWLPLNPPIMRGWKRTFVLREDVARSPQAAFYEALLEKLNTVQVSHRKDFRKKARRYGKKVHVPREQHLLYADEWQWQKWKLDPRAQRLFEMREVPAAYTGRSTKVYVFQEPWRYTLRVSPNLITRVRERDEALEARIAAIGRYFETHGLRDVAIRAVYGSARSRWYGRHTKEKPQYQWKHRWTPLHQLVSLALDDAL